MASKTVINGVTHTAVNILCGSMDMGRKSLPCLVVAGDNGRDAVSAPPISLSLSLSLSRVEPTQLIDGWDSLSLLYAMPFAMPMFDGRRGQIWLCSVFSVSQCIAAADKKEGRMEEASNICPHKHRDEKGACPVQSPFLTKVGRSLYDPISFFLSFFFPRPLCSST